MLLIVKFFFNFFIIILFIKDLVDVFINGFFCFDNYCGDYCKFVGCERSFCSFFFYWIKCECSDCIGKVFLYNVW